MSSVDIEMREYKSNIHEYEGFIILGLIIR
jgi:hypothetical protein